MPLWFKTILYLSHKPFKRHLPKLQGIANVERNKEAEKQIMRNQSNMSPYIQTINCNFELILVSTDYL